MFCYRLACPSRLLAVLLAAATTLILNCLIQGTARADYELPDGGLPPLVEDVAQLNPEDWPLEVSPTAHLSGWLGQPETSTPVIALDDALNPYVSQYEDWDRWLYDNYCPYTAGSVIYNTLHEGHLAQAGEDQFWYTGWLDVDSEGHALPLRLSWSRQLPRLGGQTIAELSTGLGIAGGQPPRLARMFAAGLMPRELYESMQRARAEVQAPYLPPVPAWLAADPPLAALLTPAGEVLCQGAPGCAADWPAPEALDRMVGSWQFMQWQRFSADGAPLGSWVSERGESLGFGWPLEQYGPRVWSTATFLADSLEVSPNWEQEDRRYASCWWRVTLHPGTDPATGRSSYSALSAVDLLGNSVDINTPLPQWGGTYYMLLPGSDLPWIYAAQQARH